MKNSNDTIGNRTRDLRLVAQFLNQLRHRVLPIKVLFTPYTVILITYIYIYIYIHTGPFIIFSVKTEKVFLTTIDVRCVHHGCHGTHRYDIQVLQRLMGDHFISSSADTQFQ